MGKHVGHDAVVLSWRSPGGLMGCPASLLVFSVVCRWSLDRPLVFSGLPWSPGGRGRHGRRGARSLCGDLPCRKLS